ncbi:MAG: SpoIIE family protein phosphatase [Candidatus Aminicenantes bacterium]|nr:SpoIIE family protein phosphatase [Candidatus Aminicenantes bacterium]
MKRQRLFFYSIVFPVIFLFLCAPFFLKALEPGKVLTQYSKRSWNMESGLPNNKVFALLQTRDGYLWIGTSNGLARFDGTNFEVYNKKKNTQIKDNENHALYEDSGGVLWIGTQSGGLTRCKEGEFFTYPITKYEALSKIRAIDEDRWGSLWVGSSTEGLTRWDSENPITYTKKDGLPDNEIKSIYKDDKGDLWISTAAGIVKLIEPGRFQLCPAGEDLPYPVCLYETGSEELWIGTAGVNAKGLFRFKNEQSTLYGAKAGLPNLKINCLYMDKKQNLWIGTESGLTRERDEVFSTFPGDDDLAKSYVQSIYEDKEGSLWIGTVGGGLHQLKDSKFTTYTDREGLSHNYIHCICETQAGDIWIGTSEGLNRLQRGALRSKITTNEGLGNDLVSSLFEDPAGYLWIGTWGGLHRFKDGRLTTFTGKQGLSDERIWYITGDSDGNTWVATKIGLNRFNHKTGTFKVFTREDGLLSNDIKFLFADQKGYLWISSAAGLNRINAGVISPYKLDVKLDDYTVNCAYEDDESVLWLGTENGLIRLRGDETILYNRDCGLTENYITSILEDKGGCLWLGGRNGISRIKKKDFVDFSAGKIDWVNPTSYNETDGMKSGWCSRNGIKTRDGRFWFPTLIGVTTIDPNNIERNTQALEVIIEKFIVDGETKDINSRAGEKEPLVLPPGKKRFEFYYTAPSFLNPGKIKYTLRLVGYESDWVDMGNRRSATYTRLAPGDYTFEVIAGSPDGVWNEKAVSFSFYLVPHITERPEFYIIAGLFVIFSVFFIYRLRVRQLRVREKKLSALVEVRTKDLQERNTELEKAQQEISRSKEIIEEKNRHITESIHYASRIQQAMLPVKEKMAGELKDYFIIYKPKAIVSGDFYWFDVIGDLYFLAAADCTGHGVPGALLSMIGHMKLNEAIREKQILDPTLVLSHLHEGFRSALKQEAGKTETYDGMDAALCRIDKETGRITFAGANRPLLYVKDSQLIEIKGNRRPIGGRQKEEQRFFTGREIDILEGKEEKIMLYLTTDGFADQQNPQNHRYGSRRLKEFLRDHAHLSAAQQKEALLEELRKHQGSEEQRDDITIIGIRIGKSPR